MLVVVVSAGAAMPGTAPGGSLIEKLETAVAGIKFVRNR